VVEQEPKEADTVNEFTYFVSHDSLSGWVKLPDLTLDQLKAARKIKVMFTGDLERKIFTNPFFFGQEKHYLRAQIARITHTTTLFPHGLWKRDEDDDSGRGIIKNEPDEGELEMPSTLEMGTSAMWVHAKKNILLNGRT
jgi:radial spoke head protein 4/6